LRVLAPRRLLRAADFLFHVEPNPRPWRPCIVRAAVFPVQAALQRDCAWHTRDDHSYVAVQRDWRRQCLDSNRVTFERIRISIRTRDRPRQQPSITDRDRLSAGMSRTYVECHTS
jgi:hypothetical protein